MPRRHFSGGLPDGRTLDELPARLVYTGARLCNRPPSLPPRPLKRSWPQSHFKSIDRSYCETYLISAGLVDSGAARDRRLSAILPVVVDRRLARRPRSGGASLAGLVAGSAGDALRYEFSPRLPSTRSSRPSPFRSLALTVFHHPSLPASPTSFVRSTKCPAS